MKRALFPIERLQKVQEDLRKFQNENELNGYQTWILDSLYDLSVPTLDFPVRSVVMVASPIWPSQPASFVYQGRQYTYPSPGGIINPGDTVQSIMKILQAEGMRVQYAENLPYKRLAVCSGLAMYGKNNITFVEGMGSYHVLSAFFADVECMDDPWREPVIMERCSSCDECLRACPTQTILEQRFLIDNQRCLTSMNQNKEPEVFPDWVSPMAHTCVVQCLTCQSVCPKNKPYQSNVPPSILFTDEETQQLLTPVSFDVLSDTMQERVLALDWQNFLAGLPRNLHALFAKE